MLFDEATGQLHVLNPVAALTWACFDGLATVGDIVADLSDVFGADEEVVRGDVTALVERLAAHGLLSTGAPGPEAEEAEDRHPPARSHPPRPVNP